MSFQLIELERSVTPFAQRGDNVETKVSQTEPEVTTDSSPEEPIVGNRDLNVSPDSSPVSDASFATNRSSDSPREEPESDKTVTPEEPIQTEPQIDEPERKSMKSVEPKEELAPTPEPEVDESEDVSNDSYLVRSPAEAPEYTDTETTHSSD